MPMGNKIALFGMGRMSRVILAGSAALSLTETKNKETIFDEDILKLIEPPDYTALVKAYKKVQRKYNPEKDILIKREK